jgi:hypothetical protein
MFSRVPAKTALLCFCLSWLIGTNSLSLAQDRAGDTDLYGTGRGENASSGGAQLDPQNNNTDLYGTGRGADSSRAAPPPVSPGKEADMYGGTSKTRQEFPAGKTDTRDKENDLYSREIRAKEAILVINRPPNIQGLTGLMVTNSAFTRPAGTLAVGGSAMIEDSGKPDYSVIQVPITLTFGITETIEAGFKAKYVNYGKNTEAGLGDTELAVKWRGQTHSSTFPELAVGMAGILPTASESKGLNDVKNWGVKVIALATSETSIASGSVLGIYLETQAVFIDGFSYGKKTNTQDRYGVINVGVLLPVSTNNRFQTMIELSDTLGKKRSRTALGEGDQMSITPALRYVTDTLSVTAGAQFLSKEAKGYEDTIRWVGTISYQF